MCVPFNCEYTLQMQLTSLKKSKKQKTKVIRNLQETIKIKEAEIQALSQQVAAKEGQETYTEDTAELQIKEKMFMELADMTMNIIQLQNEVDQMRTAAKLSKEEASYYQEHATSLHAITYATIKVQ